MPLTTQEALDLLGHKLSAKRRQGAKRLRALAAAEAAPALKAALEREVQDARTWETQYQMIMALAMTGSRSDVSLLRELAVQPRHATMVNLALGDAIVRLDRAQEHDVTPVLWCLDQEVTLLDEGALRAVAMLRLSFAPRATDELLARFVDEPPDSSRRYWPTVAAAGWEGERVRTFLQSSASSPRIDLVEAAEDSLAGRYRKMHIL